MLRQPVLRIASVALIVSALTTSPAVADAIALNLSDSVHVTVNYEGKPLKDQGAVAALLSLASEGQEPFNKAVS